MHGMWVAGHTLGTAILPLGHEPGTRQHGHVFLHGGKRHVVVRGEFAHGRLGVHDPRQDVATRGIGERAEQLVQSLRGLVSIYNHLVVDTSTVPRSTTAGSLPQEGPVMISACHDAGVGRL
jgi:hypothetical protein